MPDDDKFLERFEDQAKLLRKLHTEVGEAIKRADDNIVRMRQGESWQDIFGPVPPKQ